MSILINETDLPQELDNTQAVEAAYSSELAEVASKLQRGLPTLIECDKDLAPFLCRQLARPAASGQPALPLPRRPAGEATRSSERRPMPVGLIGTMIAQLRDAVRGAVEQRVVVLPHLDLLTTSQGGLTAEAREVIPLLYENPELVWLGFKDPSFPLPTRHREPVPASRQPARHRPRSAAAPGHPPGEPQVRPRVQSVDAVQARLRHERRSAAQAAVHARRRGLPRRPAPTPIASCVRPRSAARSKCPTSTSTRDIGGYAKVKKRLRAEILDVLARKDKLTERRTRSRAWRS